MGLGEMGKGDGGGWAMFRGLPVLRLNQTMSDD